MNSNTQEKIRISRQKKGLRSLSKKENFKSEIKSMIDNLQEKHFIKTNKQKVLDFMLTSDGSWRMKNARKLFSKYLKDNI